MSSAAKRYEVTVTLVQKVIIYAADAEQASLRARLSLGSRGTSNSLSIDSVSELPAVETEARGPEIDRSPSRETRQ